MEAPFNDIVRPVRILFDNPVTRSLDRFMGKKCSSLDSTTTDHLVETGIEGVRGVCVTYGKVLFAPIGVALEVINRSTRPKNKMISRKQVSHLYRDIAKEEACRTRKK